MKKADEFHKIGSNICESQKFYLYIRFVRIFSISFLRDGKSIFDDLIMVYKMSVFFGTDFLPLTTVKAKLENFLHYV